MPWPYKQQQKKEEREYTLGSEEMAESAQLCFGMFYAA